MFLSITGPSYVENTIIAGLSFIPSMRLSPFGIFVEKTADMKGYSLNEYIQDNERVRFAWVHFNC